MFELAVREATGEPIEELEYPVSVGLAAEPGMGMIRVGETGVSHTFPIGNINEPKAYMAFVQKLVFPYGKKLMKQPRNDEYLVDLYYKWPRVLVEKKQFNVFDLFPSLLTWDKDIARKLRIYVGSTWCFKDDQGNHQQVQSGHLRTYKESIEAYTKVLELENEGDTYEVIAALEEYVALVPGDKKALKS